MSRFAKELIESAEEAVAIASGKRKPARVYNFREDRIDVAAIRKKVGASQAKFAKEFGLAAGTVRDWEQKRRAPDRLASAYLRVIAHAPDVVRSALTMASRPAAKPQRKKSPARVRVKG
jgi:putative transcriptional regulator